MTEDTEREPGLPGKGAGRLRQLMEELYAEVDAEIAAVGAVCEASGVCCDFERADHVLYASTPELEYVRELHPRPFSAGSVQCPFWIDGRCCNRERRPLGCRTYFCDPAHRDRLEATYERYLSRLREIARSEGLPWRYEPFVAALRGPSAASEIVAPSSENT